MGMDIFYYNLTTEIDTKTNSKQKNVPYFFKKWYLSSHYEFYQHNDGALVCQMLNLRFKSNDWKTIHFSSKTYKQVFVVFKENFPFLSL